MTEPVHQIYLSHHLTDDAVGQRLARDLRRALGSKAAVWYDARSGMHGGDHQWQQAQAAMERCDVFIVLLTPAAMASAWVNNEIDYAWKLRRTLPNGKRILPLLVRPCQIRDDLDTLHHISFALPRPYTEALAEVLRELPLALPASTASRPPARVLPALSGRYVPIGLLAVVMFLLASFALLFINLANPASHAQRVAQSLTQTSRTQDSALATVYARTSTALAPTETAAIQTALVVNGTAGAVATTAAASATAAVTGPYSVQVPGACPTANAGNRSWSTDLSATCLPGALRITSGGDSNANRVSYFRPNFLHHYTTSVTISHFDNHAWEELVVGDFTDAWQFTISPSNPGGEIWDVSHAGSAVPTYSASGFLPSSDHYTLVLTYTGSQRIFQVNGVVVLRLPEQDVGPPLQVHIDLEVVVAAPETYTLPVSADFSDFSFSPLP